jgi:hypothetical protein
MILALLTVDVAKPPSKRVILGVASVLAIGLVGLRCATGQDALVSSDELGPFRLELRTAGQDSLGPFGLNVPEDLSRGSVVGTRPDVLQWLDEYSEEVVLFEREYILAIRDQVADLSPDEFNRWLNETVEIRKALDSPEWRATRKWLREFLTVTTWYGEEEIVQARADVERLSSDELIGLVSEIVDFHRRLKLGNLASERQRKASLAAAAGFRKRRLAALDRAGLSRAPRFNTYVTNPIARPRPYRPRRPFVGFFFRW